MLRPLRFTGVSVPNQEHAKSSAVYILLCDLESHKQLLFEDLGYRVRQLGLRRESTLGNSTALCAPSALLCV